jgi:HAD superfamily hydrolase (TIGR01509 family)
VSASPIAAVLLDMGGVLVGMGNEAGLPRDEHDREGRAEVLRLLRARGGAAGDDELERLLFAPWREGYRRRYELRREADWAPHVARLLRASGAVAGVDEVLAAWFAPYGASLQPTPDAAGVLASLAGAGLPLALVSNVALPGALYRRRLEEWGFAGFFRGLWFSHDAGSRKPAPDMLRAALDLLAVEPQRAVMVGDRRASDVAAGLAAGTRTVWLRSPHADGPEPDVTLDRLADLPAALARLR